MDTVRVVVTGCLCIFYLTYIGKMLMLRRQGITGNIMGKGEKPKAAYTVEVLLRTVTFAGALIQFGSVFFPDFVYSIPVGKPVRWIGAVLAALGCVWFALSVFVMRNNWRAGFNSGQQTDLVTSGIYRYSRNPAFVGFDLIYLGCALAFPNLINLLVMVLALVLFHMQIKGEEAYLRGVFGQQYTDYAAQVSRYLGRRT